MRPFRLLVTFTCFAALSCDDPLATCAAEVSLLGAWTYEGAPSASHPYQLHGDLEITAESCEAFEGRVDVLETGETGAVRARAGAVSGRVVDGASVRFDAIFEDGVRQHLAELRSDSMVGSFVTDAAGGGGVVATGEFSSRRRSPS